MSMATKKAAKKRSSRAKKSSSSRTSSRGGASAKKSSTRGNTGAKKSSARKTSSKKSSRRKYSPSAGKNVEAEMREMKKGRLKSGRSGKTVTNPKQAIAIGLSEARREGKKVPPKKK